MNVYEYNHQRDYRLSSMWATAARAHSDTRFPRRPVAAGAAAVCEAGRFLTALREAFGAPAWSRRHSS